MVELFQVKSKCATLFSFLTLLLLYFSSTCTYQNFNEKSQDLKFKKKNQLLLKSSTLLSKQNKWSHHPDQCWVIICVQEFSFTEL